MGGCCLPTHAASFHVQDVLVLISLISFIPSSQGGVTYLSGKSENNKMTIQISDVPFFNVWEKMPASSLLLDACKS